MAGAAYLEQHEAIEAAVHHQPQGAGRQLSAGTLSGTLGILPVFLLLTILPLYATLLLPLLSSLPAAENKPATEMWTRTWYYSADPHIVVKCSKTQIV